jgi:hypothetical protein
MGAGRRILTTLALILLQVGLFSISAQQQTTRNSLAGLYWLEGMWRNVSQPGIFEEWQLTHSGNLSGKLTERSSNNTGTPGRIIRTLETRLVVQVDNQIFLVVNFPGTGIPEKRYTLRRTLTSFVFTNKSNSYPQIIVYQRLRGNRNMKILHSDYSSEENREEIFSFEKVSGRRWRFN